MNHEFAHLTRREANTLLDGLVVIPLGATEQHGDHLPVCTDSLIVTTIAERFAEDLGRRTEVIVTPTIPVGISGHHLPFGGTLTFSAPVYAGMLVDLVVGLRTQGYTRTLFLNGHGGNDSAMRTAVDQLAGLSGPAGIAAGISYWDAVPESVTERLSGPVPGHAGVFETSVVLSVRPDLVRDADLGTGTEIRALIGNEIPGIRGDRSQDWRASDGASDGAAAADRELGDLAIRQTVAELVDRVERYFDLAEVSPS